MVTAELGQVLLYLLVLIGYTVFAVGLIWAAGYALAVEDLVGGMRARAEEWAYLDAQRYRVAPLDASVHRLIDRARPWTPFRKPVGLAGWAALRKRWHGAAEEEVLYQGPGMEFDRRSWTNYLRTLDIDAPRPYPVMVVQGALGRKKLWRGPLVDELPLSWSEWLLTVGRAKLVDLWRCPRCASWWSSLVGLVVVLLAMNHLGLAGWLLAGVVVAHFAAWGLARRLDWD